MTQVTRAQLAAQRQKDEEQTRLRIEQHDRKVKDRTVTEDEYEDLVSRPNLNHETNLVQAKSVEEAIVGLQEIGISKDKPAVVSGHFLLWRPVLFL